MPGTSPTRSSSREPCGFCDGTGTALHTAYTHQGPFGVECPRCDGTGDEPTDPKLHVGLLLRNKRSSKVWAIYSAYEGRQARPSSPGEQGWGIHRMIPDRCDGGHYVWQIRILPERVLLSRWESAGYGDAWDHEKMEADPLRKTRAA